MLTQPIHIINRAHIPARTITRVERAILYQANHDLRPVWHTPRVSFTNHGWGVLIDPTFRPGGAHYYDHGGLIAPGCTTPAPGCHAHATISTKTLRGGIFTTPLPWTAVLSHEIIEMTVDPHLTRRINDSLVEVCDPTADQTRTIQGVKLSRWVPPAYYHRHH